MPAPLPSVAPAQPVESGITTPPYLSSWSLDGCYLLCNSNPPNEVIAGLVTVLIVGFLTGIWLTYASRRDH